MNRVGEDETLSVARGLVCVSTLSKKKKGKKNVKTTLPDGKLLASVPAPRMLYSSKEERKTKDRLARRRDNHSRGGGGRLVAAKGKFLDATQEMIALGVCNIFGSFVRSMPVTGSFTRTAVNHASGVRTPLGGIFTGTQSDDEKKKEKREKQSSHRRRIIRNANRSAMQTARTRKFLRTRTVTTPSPLLPPVTVIVSPEVPSVVRGN